MTSLHFLATANEQAEKVSRVTTYFIPGESKRGKPKKKKKKGIHPRIYTQWATITFGYFLNFSSIEEGFYFLKAKRLGRISMSVHHWLIYESWRKGNSQHVSKLNRVAFKLCFFGSVAGFEVLSVGFGTYRYFLWWSPGHGARSTGDWVSQSTNSAGRILGRSLGIWECEFTRDRESLWHHIVRIAMREFEYSKGDAHQRYYLSELGWNRILQAEVRSWA